MDAETLGIDTLEPATLEPATLEPATLEPATLDSATLEPATLGLDHATLGLIQLFHTLPYEIKEIIQRFTYKCQNKSLLNDIKAFHAAKQYLQEFTTLIDNSYSDHATTDSVKERLLPGLNYIRAKTYKKTLIKHWKYKSEFNSAEQEHTNEEKAFRLMDWSTSYTVYFWMCIHH